MFVGYSSQRFLSLLLFLVAKLDRLYSPRATFILGRLMCVNSVYQKFLNILSVKTVGSSEEYIGAQSQRGTLYVNMSQVLVHW